jgi:tetratricopeptide (TPR) repeat protein
MSKFSQEDVRFEASFKLGLLYLSQKRPGEAIPALTLAARSLDEGTASEAQFYLGEAYWQAGNKDSALLQFSRVVYLYPHRAEVMEEALLKLGTYYVEEKKFSEARQIYQKLLDKTKREDRRERARKALDQIGKGTAR